MKARIPLWAAWGLLVLGLGKVAGQSPPYLDALRPVDERVQDLLRRMTLEEKIGQMNIAWGGGYAATRKGVVEGDPKRTGSSKPVGIALGWATDILAGPRKQAEMDNDLKALALKSSRLGIPLLHVEEGVHGLFVPGASIFPQPIGLGATFDLDLIGKVAEAMGEEARALGVRQLSTSPVLDVLRDPRRSTTEFKGEEPGCSCGYGRSTMGNRLQGALRILWEDVARCGREGN